METLFLPEFRYYYNTDQRNFSLSVCTCGREHRLNGYYWGPGITPYYDICHVIKGTGTYTLNGVTYPLKSGDTFIACPGLKQTVCSDESTEWEYIWIGFTGNDAAPLLNRMGFTESNPVQHTGCNPRVVELHGQLASSCGYELSDSIAMTGILYLLFATFFKQLGCDRKTVPDLFQKALEYIHAHLKDNLKVETLCREINISRSWLYRKFMENMGQSPIEYINHQRMLQSCYTLTNTRLSIEEISSRCGFSDALYFSRLFRKNFGMSPTQFRKTNAVLPEQASHPKSK